MVSLAISFATAPLGYQAAPAVLKAPAGAAAGAARSAMQMAELSQLSGGAYEETGGKPWGPLGISDMCPYGSMNYEWMRTAEIKHGRVCTAASAGWLVQQGVRFNVKTCVKTI